MEFVRKLAKPLAPVISLAMLLMSFAMPVANAKVVTTQTMLDHAKVKQERKRLREFYTRKDVRSALQKYGLTATEAQARIDSMSDQQVLLVAQQIDKMPAGAGVGEAVLVVFLVLIILELLHITNIFSFI